MDALPLCGLNETAEDMLAMVNTTEGLVILNTDRITMIGKMCDNNFRIVTDFIISTEVNTAAEYQDTQYRYREFVVSGEELADLLSKLPEAKHFPKE